MMRRTTTATGLSGFAALVAIGAMVSVSPAQAAGETCQGRPATIVGTGPEIQGTPGDDVIVTGASKVTYANAGNDLVCITPGSPEGVNVAAGEGDDVVDASASSASGTFANLGVGVDRYLGGVGTEQVYADGTDDTVEADSAYLMLTAPVTGTPGTYTVGSISVWSADLDVEVNLGTNLVTVGGVHAANLSADIVRAKVVAPRAVLRGNAADNHLSGSGCDVLFVGKGGNDGLYGGYDDLVPHFNFECVDGKATMRGGPGNDSLVGAARHTNRLIGNAGNDQLQGRIESDVLLGGSGRDDLNGGPGSDLLRGGSGKDTLLGGSGRDDLNGGAGSDVLLGNPGRDTLIGGGGFDKADGHRGRDRCAAERERRCER